MKWLYRIISLLYGCRHKWDVINVVDVYEASYSSRPCARKYIMKCTKCGKITKKET